MMENRRITKKEAATLLVEMISDLRLAGHNTEPYHEAVALACAELLKDSLPELPKED